MTDIKGPLGNLINSYNKIKWRKIFKGFEEFEFSVSPSEKTKRIKLDHNKKYHCIHIKEKSMFMYQREVFKMNLAHIKKVI